MASTSDTLFCSVSHSLLVLLVSGVLIRYSESCPNDPFNFDFSCPDNVYNGPLSSSIFSNTSRDNEYDCGGPCELTCNYANHTMIKCTRDDTDTEPYQVLEINPNLTNPSITIVVDHSDGWLRDPCEAYTNLNSSFPFFKSVSLSIDRSSGENETFLGCSNVEGDVYSDFLIDNKKSCETAVVYGPYDYAQIPRGKLPPPHCMQFLKLHFPANKTKGKLRRIIYSFVCSVITVIILIAILYWRRRNNKAGLRALPSRITSLNHTRSDLEEGSVTNGVTVFSYAELQDVTNNFDPERELGEGGFGVVYHGKLEDGREVAVKRMFEKNYKQIEQFKNEIHILTNVRHPNLVTLYGSTSRHSRELLLVYEYIPNGTLSDHLHGNQSKSVLLLWSTRLKIAIQTASALCYLHHNDIIHRDIKSNNILLDKSFVAKVADFGLSRLFPSDVSHVSTAPQGTPGYLDPEYHQCYHLTDRSDVYSFGVVLVELISSMEAVDLGRERHEVNLANYAMNRIQGCEFGELVDVNLGYEKSFKVRRMITLVAELAFRCLQHEREIRPSMEEVLEALKSIESVDYDGLEAEEMG